MTLFIIGIIEMAVITSWTKAVNESKIWVSGIITVINIFIWYYVLETVINNIDGFRLIIWYALGCAIGTMGSTLIFKQINKLKREKIFLKQYAEKRNHSKF